MRPSLGRALLLALLSLSAACTHSPSKPEKAPKPDYEGTRRRAAQAHEGLDPVSGRAPKGKKRPAVEFAAPAGQQDTIKGDQLEPTLGVAPETSPSKAKVLGEDKDGCTWIASEATVTVGAHDTQAQVRAAAVAEARRSAMQDFLGVNVRSRSLDFQQETLRGQTNLIENMLQTTRLGRILKEKVDEARYQSLPGCEDCRYRVKLRACLTPIPGDSDRDFQVEIEISQSRFIAGSEARLTVTATRDCSVYLYDVGMDGETALIVPNALVPQADLKAGQVWEYPDFALKKRGATLVAQMPDEKTEVSAEVIRVIATRTPLPNSVYSPTGTDYLGVLRRLHRSRAQWAEDAQAFTIYRK